VDTRSVRRALDLRLIDVSRATGISAARLSLAERGLAKLTVSERRAIENFLGARLTAEIAEQKDGE
jgi:hypothetical protein